MPGSHRRPDTAEEAAALQAPPPDREGLDEAEYVLAAARYRRRMPGARKVVLSPGDVAFYRDSAIHLGHYIPTMKRATMHGHFESTRTRQFFAETFNLTGQRDGQREPGTR